MAKEFEPWTIVLRLTGIGWYVATCIILGVVGGRALDNLIGTKPLFILLGIVLGFVVAGWGFYKMVQPILTASKGKDAEDQGRKR